MPMINTFVLYRKLQLRYRIDLISQIHIGIDSRCSDIGVPQQVLHRREICAAPNQIGSIGVSHFMRRKVSDIIDIICNTIFDDGIKFIRSGTGGTDTGASR